MPGKDGHTHIGHLPDDDAAKDGHEAQEGLELLHLRHRNLVALAAGLDGGMIQAPDGGEGRRRGGRVQLSIKLGVPQQQLLVAGCAPSSDRNMLDKTTSWFLHQ
jgi:hypothetical protein